MEQRHRWLQTRKKLLRQIKEQVSSRLGAEPADVAQYAREYKATFNGVWTSTDYDDLFATLKQARVCIGADFHAFTQSQRVHLRLLRALPQNTNLVLLLECFESRHQPVIDAYMRGDIGEDQLLEETLWHKRWGFPWENYKPLLDLAKKMKIPVVGINRYFSQRRGEGLIRRDIHAANQVAKAMNENPDALIYIIYGDLHLARPHLPRRIEERTGLSSKQIVCVFQNSEKLYFGLARQGLEASVEIMKGPRNRYCILASPPWVKWQSYLMYLEQTYDRGLEDEDEEDGLDFTDHVQTMIAIASQDLNLKLKTNDVAVYSAGQQQLWSILSENLSGKYFKIADYLIENDRSFYIPSLGLFYLSRLTINHAASLAGQYIQAKLSGRMQPLWDMPQQFLALIWLEAVGFFVSKLINHKRKAENLREIKAQLSVLQAKDRGHEALLLVLDQRLSETIYIHSGKSRPRRFKPRRKQSYIYAAKVLGHMMGERLYLAYRSRRIDRATLIKYLEQDGLDKEFESFYYFMVRRLESSGVETALREEVG